MLWSLNSAKREGIRIDEVKLNEWTQWAVDWKHLVALPVKDADRQKTITAYNDTVAQLLLAQAARTHGADQPQWVPDFANNLGAGQQKDGSWTPGGRLTEQKRPARETQEVSTMWALLALGAAQLKEDTTAPILKNACAWLGEKTVGTSTEWWATRAMLVRKVGRAENTDHFRTELLKRQHSDGGWGWLCDDESDAFGTGLALYALGECKIPATDAITRAHQFLTRTQTADGSWPVHGTMQNRKDRIEPTATFWGTCWAVIGLCNTLDDQIADRQAKLSAGQ
jgi:squalene-hopene/tetraprenyl-beta-curcumene cyclase